MEWQLSFIGLIISIISSMGKWPLSGKKNKQIKGYTFLIKIACLILKQGFKFFSTSVLWSL